MKNKLSAFGFQLSGRNDIRPGISVIPKSQKQKAKSSRAFTLIETFVAISVLLVSLVGPLSIAAEALKSAYYARDEITAFYLAQEGLEYVRAIRDQNYLASPQEPWLACLNGVAAPSCAAPPNCVNALCQVDFVNFSATVCPQNACAPLLVDPSVGLYNSKTGSPSGFTRATTIVPVSGTANEVEVDSTVSWASAGIRRSFTLSEHLFNWL